MTTTPKFDFNGHQLRSVLIDGEPWFVAADACRILEMDLSAGTHRWLVGLDSDEKRNASRLEYPQLLCGFRGVSLTLISRPGLFKLIQRSNKPEAKEFDRWVRHEVLPQGRSFRPSQDRQSARPHGPYRVSTQRNSYGTVWRCFRRWTMDQGESIMRTKGETMANQVELITRSFALPLTLGLGALWSALRRKEGRDRVVAAFKGSINYLATSSFLDKIGQLMKWGFAAFLLIGLYQSIRSAGWEAGRDYQARVCFRAPGTSQCLRNAPYEDE